VRRTIKNFNGGKMRGKIWWFLILFIVCFLFLNIHDNIHAAGLHGSMVWGSGSISTQMGGTGVAMPLDALTAVWRNPAGLSFFDHTVYDLDFSHVRSNANGKYEYPDGFPISSWDGTAGERNYPMLGTAFAYQLKEDEKHRDSRLSFGGGVAITAGAGDDYTKETPMTSLYLCYSAMFSASYRVNENFAIGLGPRINFGVASLGYGHSVKNGIGYQIGTIYKKNDWSFGASYVSAISIKYARLTDMDLDGSQDEVELEEPQQVYVGISYSGFDKWILNLGGHWINYAGAALYKDIDWDDLWAYNLGVQYNVLPRLKLRLGYLYHNQQQKGNPGFDAAGTRNFQGLLVNNAFFELWKNSSLPLYMQHHFGGGFGYDLWDGLSFNLGIAVDLHNGVRYRDSTGDFLVDQDNRLYWVFGGFRLSY